MANNASRHITAAKRGGVQKKPLTFIIPCAGSGARMKSYGPKALLSIGNTTIIERQISIIQEAFPASEIIVPIGFDAYKMCKRLEPLGVRMVFNPLHETTNVAFSIGLGLYANISPNVAVVYGDLVFNKSVLHTLIGCSKSTILVGKGMKDEEVGVLCQNGELMRAAYGFEHKWAQIAFFTGRELRLLKKICHKEENNKIFGYEALNEIIANGGTFHAVLPTNGMVCDIDSPKDIDEALKIPLTL